MSSKDTFKGKLSGKAFIKTESGRVATVTLHEDHGVWVLCKRKAKKWEDIWVCATDLRVTRDAARASRKAIVQPSQQ